MKTKTTAMVLSLNLFAVAAFSQTKADDITGTWLTGGKESAKIQIYRSGEKFYGKITWLKNPIENGKQRVDNNTLKIRGYVGLSIFGRTETWLRAGN